MIYDKKNKIIVAKNKKELKQGIKEALPDALAQIDKFFEEHKWQNINFIGIGSQISISEDIIQEKHLGLTFLNGFWRLAFWKSENGVIENWKND